MPSSWNIGYELVSAMRDVFAKVTLQAPLNAGDVACLREAEPWLKLRQDERPAHGVASLEVVYTSKPRMQGSSFWRENVFDSVAELQVVAPHGAIFDTGDVRTEMVYCMLKDGVTFVLTETCTEWVDADVEDLRWMSVTSYTYCVALSAVFVRGCPALFGLIDQGHNVRRSWSMLWHSFTAIADVVREGRAAPRVRCGRGIEVVCVDNERLVEFGSPEEAALFDGDRWTELVLEFDRSAKAVQGVGRSTVKLVDSVLGPRQPGTRQYFWVLDEQRLLVVRGENAFNIQFRVCLVVDARGALRRH